MRTGTRIRLLAQFSLAEQSSLTVARLFIIDRLRGRVMETEFRRDKDGPLPRPPTRGSLCRKAFIMRSWLGFTRSIFSNRRRRRRRRAAGFARAVEISRSCAKRVFYEARKFRVFFPAAIPRA